MVRPVASPRSRTPSFGDCPIRRIVLPLAVLLLVSFSLRASAIDVEPVVGFGPGPGFASRYRPGSWSPVAVYVFGTGVSGPAQIQAVLETDQGAQTYTQDVTFNEGAVDRVVNFVVRPGGDYWAMRTGGRGHITARVLVDGRAVASRSLPLPVGMDPNSFNVLELTREPGGLRMLARKQMNLSHQAEFAAPWQYQQNQGLDALITEPLVTNPAALPEFAQGYEAIDAIVVGDAPLDALTERQQSALEEYVARGGLLIVTGGTDTVRLKAKPLSELMPLTASGVVSGSVDALERRYHSPLPVGSVLALTDGAPKPGATVLFSDASGRPLVTRIPIGAGAVVFTAFDPLAREMRGWPGAAALWRDLLNLRTPGRPLSASRLEGENYPYYGYNWQQGNQRDALFDALAGQRASQTPKPLLIAGFLGGYILLLIPVSYLVLKRLDRRELAWATAPILILAFTAGSYTIGLSVKGGRPTLNSGAIVDGSSGSDRFTGRQLSTLYATRRSSFRIDLRPLSSEERPLGVPAELTVGNSGAEPVGVTLGSATTLNDFEVKLWSARSFDLPIAPALGGPIRIVVARRPHGAVNINATNATRVTLRDCGLMAGTQRRSIGDLAPGATVSTVWPPPAGDDQPLPGSRDPDPTKATTPELTRDTIRGRLIGMLADQAQNGGSSATLRFVGFRYDPLVNATVDGDPVEGQNVTLIDVPVPAAPGASDPLLPANPFHRKAPKSIPDRKVGGLPSPETLK